MKKFRIRRLGVSDDQTSYRPSLHDCIEAVLEQSGELMDDVLQGMGGSPAPGKSKSSSKRTISPAALDQLRKQADGLRDTFAVQLRIAIYQSGSQNSGQESLVRFEDFQLLDENQINTNIEYALAQQEIQLAVDEGRQALNVLISSLPGWLTGEAQIKPPGRET